MLIALFTFVIMGNFIIRLEKLLDYYGLNASTFADKIGVQRSSISHLLSGRNKPSLDFIMKIMNVYPDVNLYWILNGKGNFLKDNHENEKDQSLKIENKPEPTEVKNEIQNDLFEVSLDNKQHEIFETTESKLMKSNLNNQNEIFKIVIFYTNGTFKDFKHLTD